MRPADNPFSADRLLAVRYRPQQGSFDEILGRLEKLGFRAAIVGPPGSGKTTLLEDLLPLLSKKGFRPMLVYLAEEPKQPRALRSLFRRCGSRDAVLIDSAELLSPFLWLVCRWFLRKAGAVIITAHGEGRLPELIRCTTSPELLSGILEELLQGAPEPAGASAAETYQRRGGNIRLALLDYYDYCAVL